MSEAEQTKLNQVRLDQSWKEALAEFLLSQQMDDLRAFLVAEKNADNWLNMSKNLEKEISLESYKKFAKTTARLDKVELFEAYKNSLLLVMDLQSHLIEQYNLKVTHDILERLLNYIRD